MLALPLFIVGILAADILAPGTSPHLRAVRSATPPKIDGVIDEPVWRTAGTSDRFTQRIPNDGQAPTDRTVVRVLYDDDSIYIAFDCEQVHTPMVGRLTRRDRLVESDSVTVTLGTRGDRKSAFEFSVNASGVLLDTLRFNDTDSSSDWDENWEAKTAHTAHGWSAEIRIPLRILRFDSLPMQSWDFQAQRYISERQETDVWAYVPRTTAGEVSRYGRLDGLKGLRASAPFELRPFVVGRVRRRDAGSGQLAQGTDFTASAGLDLKWHLTQDLTLDATILPDFGQVEADQLVLNLTTFETFYPEKRPFFQEGIDIFATPAPLLYTRRIGRAVDTPTLRSDVAFEEQLVDVPDPTQIYAASKLTGRLADGWSIGTLQAVTARNSVTVQLADGTRQQRLVDPETAFNVLRVKRALDENSDVGLLATAVTRAEQASTDYPTTQTTGGPMELCPNGVTLPGQARCFNNAYVAAVDGRWRSPDGDYSAAAQVAASVLDRGPVRAVLDGTLIHPGEPGYGALATLSKDGGTHWVAGASGDLATTKLDFNDLGYMRRANQYEGSGYLEYRELSPVGPFLELHVNANAGFGNNMSGLDLGQVYTLDTFGKLTNFWTFYGSFYFKPARFDDREVGDGTALQRAGVAGNELQLQTDPTKRVAFAVDQVTEILDDGFNTTGNARATVRVLPQFDVDLLPTWLYTYGEPRFAVNGAGVGQYLFGKLDARSIGVTLRSTYTFTPRLTLQAYAQLFLASGHYSDLTQVVVSPGVNNTRVHINDLLPFTGTPPTNPDLEEGVLNVDLVLRWEYMLGSTLFLVYQHAQVPSTTLGLTDVGSLNLAAIGRAPASDIVLLKLSYWWGG